LLFHPAPWQTPTVHRIKNPLPAWLLIAALAWTGVFPGYAYDQVSNRIGRISTIAGIANQGFNYNANDHIDGSGYAYDDNGSTTQAPDGSQDVYSFENQLIRCPPQPLIPLDSHGQYHVVT